MRYYLSNKHAKVLSSTNKLDQYKLFVRPGLSEYPGIGKGSYGCRLVFNIRRLCKWSSKDDIPFVLPTWICPGKIEMYHKLWSGEIEKFSCLNYYHQFHYRKILKKQKKKALQP